MWQGRVTAIARHKSKKVIITPLKNDPAATQSIFFVSLLFLFSTIFAEQFRIEQVEYDIEGCGHWIFGQTQEYALENTVPVDTKTVFQSE